MHVAAVLCAVLDLQPGAAAKIEAAVALVMRDRHIAGLSLGLIRDGHVLYERGYGERDVARHRSVDAGTPFRIGSVTKSFTAVAVQQLAQAGKLPIDDSLSHFVSFPNAQAVTIRELLQQTSGIPSYDEAPGFDRLAARAYTAGDLLGYVRSQPLAFPPGTQWGYSNTNYVLLGEVIERASGMPYTAYLQRHIDEPLHLEATSYGDQLAQSAALGYTLNDAMLAPAPVISATATFSAGGLASSIPDLLAFDDGLLAGRLLDAQHTAQLFTPATFADGSHDRYGMGFFLGRLDDDSVVAYHDGHVPGYSALNLLEPATHTALAILTNADEIDLLPLARDVLAVLEKPTGESQTRGIGPAQNENARITERVRDLVSRTLVPHGSIRDVLFTGRERAGETIVDRYRVLCSDGTAWTVEIGYDGQERIDSLSILPAT
ncbi:MAG: serine hydrolase domain-containing protein [Vulcanimicrobiaceae bacterium]